MRRTLAAVHHRLASGPSAIVLIVVARLASSVGRAVPLPRVAEAALDTTTASVEQRVEPVRGHASEPEDVTRTPFLRAVAPAVPRFQAPSGAGPDRAHASFALRSPSASFERNTRIASSAVVESRRDGVTSPGLPAPSSRAPPIG